MELPVWSIMAVVSPISFLFVPFFEYSLEYVLIYNIIGWGIIGLVYLIGYLYHIFK